MIENLTMFATKAELVEAAAARIVSKIMQSVSENGTCLVALAGGSTPREIYAAMVQKAEEARVPWEQVHVFWGDERCVPPEHADSNYRMAHESLLRYVPIPEQNVHRIMGELNPDEAAERYAQEVGAVLAGRSHGFDLVLLGMGDDGHTASLFPGTTALDVVDADVAAVFVEKFDAWRVTLTLPLFNRGKEVLLLVAGESKAEMVERVKALHAPCKDYPVSLIRSVAGKVEWLTDNAATRLL